MPQSYSWTHPEGGMFLWVSGPQSLNTNEHLQEALKVNVAFVPGNDFFPDHSGFNSFRLNFSNAKPDRIEEGIKRLASLCVSLDKDRSI
ncbi:hypothetical protein MASR2M78_37400 [Treponema sp.]